MSHFDTRAPASPSRRPSLVPESAPSAARQNDCGDIVVSAAIGEVVLLPRLWDFRLEAVADGRIELRSATGLVAVAQGDDGALRVAGVTDGQAGEEQALLRPAS